MDGYRTRFASSVGSRDGVQLELMGPDGQYLAEVFRNDDTGERVFNSLTEHLSLPIAVLNWFLGVAEKEFGAAPGT